YRVSYFASEMLRDVTGRVNIDTKGNCLCFNWVFRRGGTLFRGLSRRYVIAAPEGDEHGEVTEFNPVIIAESTTALKRLSVSEAVMELDMTGAPVLVFRHAGHGRVNLVYRRPDGHIGRIDPPAMKADGRPLTGGRSVPMVRRLYPKAS